jgi:hypothetical protein
MKLFFNTRTQRHTAFMVLLVWLFALASGVANACLLEVRETHSHRATARFSEAAHSPDIVPSHAGAVADGVNDAHAKAPCLKVCDDGSRCFTKPDLAAAQTDPGPAPLVLVLWSAVAPVVTMLRPMDEVQHGKPELTIRVRYSRLAL